MSDGDDPPFPTDPYATSVYNLSAINYLNRLGCDMTLDQFLVKMVLPRDFIDGRAGSTAKFLTEMSWLDQIVHYIRYGYGRYHATQAPLIFIEQPNGDPPMVLVKLVVRTMSSNPNEPTHQMVLHACGNVLRALRIYDVNRFLDNTVRQFRRQRHAFDPVTYPDPDSDERLTTIQKLDILDELSKKCALGRRYSHLWLQEPYHA